MARLDELTASEIGERLRVARVAAKKTQDEAANALSVSRPTMVSIEKGQRKVKQDELERLAELYSVSLNRLLARDTVHVDLQGRFRRIGTDDGAASAALATLNRLASASVELEQMLGINFAPSYPPEQPITTGSVERQGEDAALALRHRLGIGLAPVADIVSLLETELGIRVFIKGLPSQISGLFAYDPKVGACIVLNAKHPWERRALTAAHETGHFVSNRSLVDVVEINESASNADERFANAFSYAFMMPPPAVRKRFRDIVEGDKRFTPRHLILMAHAFHVSPEAMCRQLENLELLPRGSYDSLKDRGFDREFVRGIVGDLAPTAMTNPSNPRLAQLASSAYRRELVSEGQLSRMLGMDRLEVRQLLDVLGPDEGDNFAILLQ
jgi:Zn-dependent peptidase ImmA (M78 family)/transcriptional regulator with XRE-family HTH domain